MSKLKNALEAFEAHGDAIAFAEAWLLYGTDSATRKQAADDLHASLVALGQLRQAVLDLQSDGAKEESGRLLEFVRGYASELRGLGSWNSSPFQCLRRGEQIGEELAALSTDRGRE